MSQGNSQGDRVVRAMTNDGEFRVVSCRLSAVLDEILPTAEISDDKRRELGELLTSAVLVRETTAPNRRVQMSLTHVDGAKFVADAHADGMNRGIVQSVEGREGEHHLLQINYSLLNGALHQSMVDVPYDSSSADRFMRYMQESEQIVCVCDIQTRQLGERFEVVGYVVQLLPEAEKEDLRKMVNHLTSLQEGEDFQISSMTPHQVIERICADYEFTELADSELFHGCTCSEEKFFFAISTLGQSEQDEIVQQNSVIEVTCDACGKQYEFSSERLQEYLEEASSSSAN